MTNEAMPEPRKTKRDELVDALELNYVSMALHHSNRAIAERIVDRVIMAGWQWHPPKLEPAQEIEMMDRIISGLPIDRAPFIIEEYMEEQGEDFLKQYDGVKLYDVNSMYPQEFLTPANPEGSYTYTHKNRDLEIQPPSKIPTFEEAANTWVRVPKFDNYEINCLDEVRNRFTRRILDFEKGVPGKYVEMHDKEGHAHLVSVDHISKEVFGK